MSGRRAKNQFILFREFPIRSLVTNEKKIPQASKFERYAVLFFCIQIKNHIRFLYHIHIIAVQIPFLVLKTKP